MRVNGRIRPMPSTGPGNSFVGDRAVDNAGGMGGGGIRGKKKKTVNDVTIPGNELSSPIKQVPVPTSKNDPLVRTPRDLVSSMPVQPVGKTNILRRLAAAANPKARKAPGLSVAMSKLASRKTKR